MADDIYYTIENNKIFRHRENDGWTFIRRGPERESTRIRFVDYKDDRSVMYIIAEYEKKTGKKFVEAED